MPEKDQSLGSTINPDQPTHMWGDVTDPSKHDPKKFRYLVHAFNPQARISMPWLALTSAKDFDIYDKSKGDQSVDIYMHPERLNERIAVSMSLIDQDHLGTWGKTGLIIEAPEQNVIMDDTGDMGAASVDYNYLMQQASRRGIYPADVLLKRTHATSYNEVVALAKMGAGGPLRLRAMFAKVDGDELLDPELAQKLEFRARDLGLPFVQIQELSHYSIDKFGTTDQGIKYAHFNRKRYTLGLHNDPRYAFSSYGSSDRLYFISPQELSEVLEFVASQPQATSEMLEKIKADYELADKQRKAPVLNYSDGILKSISIKHGYGKDEWEYTLNIGGYCYDRNLEQESREVREMMMGNYLSDLGDKWYKKQLGVDTTDQVISEALESVDPEIAKKIKEFYDGIRPKIVEVYKPSFSLFSDFKPFFTDKKLPKFDLVGSLKPLDWYFKKLPNLKDILKLVDPIKPTDPKSPENKD